MQIISLFGIEFDPTLEQIVRIKVIIKENGNKVRPALLWYV